MSTESICTRFFTSASVTSLPPLSRIDPGDPADDRETGGAGQVTSGNGGSTRSTRDASEIISLAVLCLVEALHPEWSFRRSKLLRDLLTDKDFLLRLSVHYATPFEEHIDRLDESQGLHVAKTWTEQVFRPLLDFATLTLDESTLARSAPRPRPAVPAQSMELYQAPMVLNSYVPVLEEWKAKNRRVLVEFEFGKKVGPDHVPAFTCYCLVDTFNDSVKFKGFGYTKKEVKNLAAKAAAIHFGLAARTDSNFDISDNPSALVPVWWVWRMYRRGS